MSFRWVFFQIVFHIYIYIYRKKWVESDRMYVGKVKRKKNMFDGLFICQRVSNSIFFWMQKYFIEINIYVLYIYLCVCVCVVRNRPWKPEVYAIIVWFLVKLFTLYHTSIFTHNKRIMKPWKRFWQCYSIYRMWKCRVVIWIWNYE